MSQDHEAPLTQSGLKRCITKLEPLILQKHRISKLKSTSGSSNSPNKTNRESLKEDMEIFFFYNNFKNITELCEAKIDCTTTQGNQCGRKGKCYIPKLKRPFQAWNSIILRLTLPWADLTSQAHNIFSAGFSELCSPDAGYSTICL